MSTKIKGISHITFICKDIEKTAYMLKQIFDAKEIYSSEEQTFSISKEKFFKIAGVWVAIMEGNSMEKTYNHVAFEIEKTDLPFFEEKILGLGLTLLPGRKRELAEGARSIFMIMTTIFLNFMLVIWTIDFDIIMIKNLIDFRAITFTDIPLMLRWFNTPHVQEYYSLRQWTEDEVLAKLTPYILGDKPVSGFIVLLDENPIGYL